MVKGRVQLRNVQNVALSKTILIDCPIGLRYHYIVLVLSYTGGTQTIGQASGALNHLLQIRVLLNGRPQRTIGLGTSTLTGGQQLQDMNILNGTAYAATGVPLLTSGGVTIPIFFAEPWRKDARDQDALAWPTVWKNSDGSNGAFNTMQLQIDTSAALNAETAFAVSAYAVVDGFVPILPQGQFYPSIVKWLQLQVPAAGVQFDISTLDRRDFYQQLSIYQDSGGSNTPSEIDLRKDGVILHELSYAANFGLLTNFGMLPTANPGTNAGARTAGIYDLVLDHDDLLGSAVDMSGTRDVTLTIKAGSAMSGTTVGLIQRLGTPE